MKRIWIVVLLSLMVLSGCEESQKDTYRKVSNEYKEVSLDSYLAYRSVSLRYEDKTGGLVLIEDNYYLDLNNEVTYVYMPIDKTVIRYHEQKDTEYQEASESLLAFITLVESEEDIQFRKLDYRIFDVIRTMFSSENQSLIRFKSDLISPQHYYRKIVINKEDIDKFNPLLEIITDLKIEVGDSIEISLRKVFPAYSLTIGDKRYETDGIDDDTTNRINELVNIAK
ncbi:MAG: hypothetical protein RBQ91_02750 [Acholeplasma sp.]|nr:hypothetical protein [Acholeplasma sp.]